MSIYLQTTPSLRKKRMTKGQRKLLAQENEYRRRNGEAPLEDLRTPALDKEKLSWSGNGSNMPNYGWNPRGASTAHIPSLINRAPADAHSTGRNTVMDKVQRGEITGKDAEEIVRKSKCLAPAYNKGAVQYIGSEDAARDAGKKTGG